MSSEDKKYYIEDLEDIKNIKNTDIIIIEDEEDTKKCTIDIFKKSISGDYSDPSPSLFYSSDKVNSIKGELTKLLGDKADSTTVDAISKRLADIVSAPGDGTKDIEIVDARDGETSLQTRLERDIKIAEENKLTVLKKPVKVTDSTIEINVPYSKTIGNIDIKVDYDDISLVGTLTLTNKDGSYSVTRAISYSGSTYNFNLDLNDITISTDIDGASITVEYESYYVNSEYLFNEITNINNRLEYKIDTCNLIEDYGTYLFFDNYSKIEEDAAKYTFSNKFDFKRNGRPSLKVDIRNTAVTDPFVTKGLKEPIKVDLASLMFYVDKLTIEKFDSADGIGIILSSDSPTLTSPSNYYFYYINNTQMVPGWNTIKKSLNEFTKVGSPDPTQIKTVQIKINRSDSINGSTMYFNSIIFNQRMKPVLLFNFNSIYDYAFDYTYPYLLSRGIPFTIFSNDGITLNNNEKEEVMNLKMFKGCDLGVYGCNPNKELLLDDYNAREQYLALQSSREYIVNNYATNPISYSAPFGDLRDITGVLLKEMGYKIVRVETSTPSYCSFFSEKDFCIPVIKINNLTTTEKIKDCIDYAIATGQCISLFTNNITEYGDEANAKQLMFELVIDYIQEKVNAGELECMTYRQFYETCIL